MKPPFSYGFPMKAPFSYGFSYGLLYVSGFDPPFLDDHEKNDARPGVPSPLSRSIFSKADLPGDSAVEIELPRHGTVVPPSW